MMSVRDRVETAHREAAWAVGTLSLAAERGRTTPGILRAAASALRRAAEDAEKAAQQMETTVKERDR